MQTFKVVFYLRKSRTKADGTVPVYSRIYLNTDRCEMGSTGYAVKESDWDERKCRVKGKSVAAMQTNRSLEALEEEYKGIFRRWEYNPDLSLENIKADYSGGIIKVKKGETVLAFLDEYLKESKAEVGISHQQSNYSRYALTRKLFAEFLMKQYGKKDITFNMMSLTMMEEFDKYMRRLGLHNNTVTKRMRIMKTMITTAFQRGKVEKNPFDGFKLHYEPSDRGFLTDEAIQKLLKKEFKIARLRLVRDLFIFSCFTGLAFIDVVGLTEENIVELDGRMWLMTKRHKTNIPSNVLLLDIPLAIIARYKGQDATGHLLPTYSHQKVNSYLKEIADVCEIEKNLTFHLARHTFATMSISKGVSMESVSKMLGHTSIRTTQIYARITNKKIEQDMMALSGKLENFSAPV